MISETRFIAYLEGLKLYKALISRIYGTLLDPDVETPPIECYNYLTEGFIGATLNDTLNLMFEIAEENDPDMPWFAFEMLDNFINYGYTYTLELDGKVENINSPYASSYGKKIETVEEFYNYWVLGIEPDKPSVEKVYHSSDITNWPNYFDGYMPDHKFTF